VFHLELLSLLRGRAHRATLRGQRVVAPEGQVQRRIRPLKLREVPIVITVVALAPTGRCKVAVERAGLTIRLRRNDRHWPETFALYGVDAEGRLVYEHAPDAAHVEPTQP
jgi:hypothetical protein